MGTVAAVDALLSSYRGPAVLFDKAPPINVRLPKESFTVVPNRMSA
jgi:hypothetical protein